MRGPPPPTRSPIGGARHLLLLTPIVAIGEESLSGVRADAADWDTARAAGPAGGPRSVLFAAIHGYHLALRW